jgi:hypothetical protein
LINETLDIVEIQDIKHKISMSRFCLRESKLIREGLLFYTPEEMGKRVWQQAVQ